MSELVENPDVLLERAVRVQLAGGRAPDAVESRVAASVTHLGLVARLISPALGVAVTHGRLHDLDLSDVWWQPVLGGPFPLSVSVMSARPAEDLPSTLLDGPIRDLVEATRLLSVSTRVLWGNVASAVNGAASMIAAARPALAERSLAIASALLDQPPLRDTSITTPGGAFRRRSCCLIYRAAPDAAGPVCGDCVLFKQP
jgi:hypothetical protein